MDIREKMKKSILYFDGGMGTLLQQKGLQPGELPENWNIEHPELITEIHRSYLLAGCDIIKTNTFGANPFKFSNLAEIVACAIKNAQKAIQGFSEQKYIALDIGPLGKMLKPLGDLDFEEAVAAFAQIIKAADQEAIDLILIETMNDAYETKAAVLAAKENSNLPVFVTNVYDESGKLMTGATPAAMAALLEGLRVDAYGMNCSLGPRQMKVVAEEMLQYSSLPLIVSPNAGLPRSESGETVYEIDAEEFSEVMKEMVAAGAMIVGGCCGTNPEYIRKTVAKTKQYPYMAPQKKKDTVVSSYTHTVTIGQIPVLIGERINPTGKSKMKTALRENNINYILEEGITQQEKGVQILDVNVGLPEIDEVKMMQKAIYELQAVLDLPLQIDTASPLVMEKAMRLYNGKPLVNSVNGKEESMETVFPLVAKYGGVIIALTLDEKGIPQSAAGRLEIAEKIIQRAAEYGIEKKDIIVDPLAMTVSADSNSANITLDTICLLKEKLEVATSLGVSNISFGLPNREDINATFFAMALQNGLDCAIMNPYALGMLKAYYSYLALRGMDANCEQYIAFATKYNTKELLSGPIEEQEKGDALERAIEKGLKEKAYAAAQELLQTKQPLEIINGHIIPALDKVGKGFEAKTMFLPQLLMSAEAAKEAFDAVKEQIATQGGQNGQKIILATVKGDIHDIGKNIVKVLLENYGFTVFDLGRDVEPAEICRCAIENEIHLVGLSALMTTTVPFMEETIKLLRQTCPQAKVVVGGAVLTQEYADMIGADQYAKDAMETVRYAEQFFANAKMD